MPTLTFSRLNPDKQGKIIHCAANMFARNGYSGTSMEAVAESAGIAKGALYRYFSGKKDLFMQVVEYLREDANNYAMQFLTSHEDLDVFDTIRDWIVSIYEISKRFSMHRQVLCNVLYQEALDFKGEVLAKFGKLSTHYTRLVLQHGIARGEVREDVDLDAAAFIIESVIDRFHDGVMMPYLDKGYALYQQPQEIIERKADQLILAFRRAFGKEKPQTEQIKDRELHAAHPLRRNG